MRLKTKFQDEYFDLEEVVDVDIATMPDGRIKVQARAMRGGLRTIFYKTKAKFDADWEDAPDEPKGIIKIEKSIVPTCVHIEYSTEEEAEKAVEKLKAFNRLRDKGFKFDGFEIYNGGLLTIDASTSVDENAEKQERSDVVKYLDTCFGGEE